MKGSGLGLLNLNAKYFNGNEWKVVGDFKAHFTGVQIGEIWHQMGIFFENN